MARTGLGRGLDALIGPRQTAPRPPAHSEPTTPAPGNTEGAAQEIRLEAIDPNAAQPRRVFDRAELEGLATSIKEHGVLQPVVVSRAGGRYRLIAGERRVQAARLAGLATIPAVVREDAAHSPLELALIENLQRTDLNAIEEAHAYRALLEQHGLTQDDIAARVGRNKSTISNTLRLLAAPEELQQAVNAGELTEGHLRALLPLESEQARIASRQVIRDKLSVRQTEALVRRLSRDGGRARPADPDVLRAQDELRAALGTKVQIAMGRRGGRITIDFYSAEEFERLFDLLRRSAK